MAKRLKYKYHTENDPVTETEIYTFSSNLAGLHREIYSQVASDHFGASTGVSIGYNGRCYAIPIKDRFMRSMFLPELKRLVANFRDFTLSRPDLSFYVVRFDNASSVFKTWEIAPLFAGCGKNCRFPVQWKPYLK